jgi:hypothetical protein
LDTLKGGELWTYGGKHVGKLQGIEIDGPDGYYLGELADEHRLITDKVKCGRPLFSFLPKQDRQKAPYHEHHAAFDGSYALHIGYSDFPRPESLEAQYKAHLPSTITFQKDD